MSDDFETETETPDDVEDETDSGGELVLVFTAEGQCVLTEDDEPVWMSDDDDDFQVEFGTEFLDPDADSKEILNWLEEEGWLDTEEKEEVIIEIEYNGDDALDNEPENEDFT